MANVFKLKQSSVAGKTPAVGQMTLGEIAVNTTDGKLFTKKNVSGTETVESFSPDSVVNAALAALTNRATNEVVTGNWTFPGEKYQSGAASELNFTAPFNGTSIPNGYLKLVTPIKASNNQMFSIDVVGYDYSAGKSIDFTVVGYAYAATSTIINIGFSNRSSFSRDVRLVLEARAGGERVMVLALGAETAAGVSNQAWYFQKLSVKVRLWAGLYATATVSDFSWVAGETTLSAGYFSSTNLNKLTMDGQLGTIVAGGAITASNLSGVNTGDQTNIAGNAGTATKLQTARTINGVAFDGTANITIADATKTPLAGTGASGTWGISITGNAATATNATNAAAAPWTGVTGKPAVIAAGADAATARAAIGAGTSNLAVGTTAVTAKAGNWVPTVAEVTGLTAALDGKIANDAAAPIAHVGSGGTAHAAATTSVAGFLSAADKTKLDSLSTLPNKYLVSEISTSTTAVAGTCYVISANLTLTLIADPAVGDEVAFADLSGLTTVIIGNNGKKIMNWEEAMTLDVPYAKGILVYTGTNFGWVRV